MLDGGRGGGEQRGYSFLTLQLHGGYKKKRYSNMGSGGQPCSGCALYNAVRESHPGGRSGRVLRIQHPCEGRGIPNGLPRPFAELWDQRRHLNFTRVQQSFLQLVPQ